MVDQNTLKSIEDLHRLKSEGIISDEDFEKAKERLLFGIQPTKRTSTSGLAGTTASSASPFADALSGLDPSLQEHLRWILLPLSRYADFNGRSSRKEFWMFQLVYAALVAVLFVAFAIPDSDGTFRALVLIAVVLAALGLLLPLLAVEARRFHDQNRSGWLVLINFVPYVGTLIVYIMMLIEGTSGENDYGSDPRQA